jgi:hypothetical protein
MTRVSFVLGATRIRGGAAALLLLCAACRDDVTAPSDPAEVEAAVDTLTLEADSGAMQEAMSARSGVAFGSWGMSNEHLNQVHTGWMDGGSISPENVISRLKGARARGGRVVIKLSKGGERHVKTNGRFSLTKWKGLVSRYRRVNLTPFIQDGTIIAHYLVDEPHREERWGRGAISRKTIEEMARFSKQLWPGMATVARVAPSWLAGASFRWRYLDAGWAQYRANRGDAGRWIAAETRAAEREGLGLLVGLNVLNGGNGSSRIRGHSRGKWAMSGSEIRRYGAALLSSRRACGFFSWIYQPGYYGRSDIRSAMAEVSRRAKAHGRTSCKQ